MPDLKQLTDLKQLRTDFVDNIDRMRRARAEHSDAMEATRDSITQSRALLTEVDAMLAKGEKAFIEEYYRKG
jgi:hypothetical protein